MRHPCLLFTLLLLCPTLNAQKNPFAGLDTTFARVLKEWHGAGFAVAVIEKDSIVYAKGFGYRDWEKKTPVTPHTLFAIGSCTKAFTSALVGLLDHQGLLSIDKPVRTYLPQLRFYNSTMDDNITLRDMMCHRTGLPRYDLSWYLFAPGSRDSMLKRIQYMEPTAAPRERWQYNNFMFFAQGMVVQQVTGASWEDNLTEKIFRPLGMKETVLSIKDLLKAGDVSLGYGLKKDSIIHRLDYHDLQDLAPAGSINSNVLDMGAWVATWLRNGKSHGKEILPAEYIGQAISSQMVIGGGLPTKEAPDIYLSNYGFGWTLSSYRGHYRVEHGGNIDGFSASTCLFPADSIGVVVLTNQNNSQIPAIVRNLIADRLLHLPYKDWSSYLRSFADKARKDARAAEAAKLSDRRPGTHPSHPLADFTGLFANPAYGGFEVTLQRDSLFIGLPQQTLWLSHYHYDVFEAFDKDPKEGIDTSEHGTTRMVFGTDGAGAISTITVTLDAAFGKPVVFTRKPKVAPMTAAQIQKYAGEYLFGGVAANASVRNATLFLLVPGQPEYELVPLGQDKFALKSLDGYFIQFVADEKGDITGLMSIQPNGTFKATRKK